MAIIECTECGHKVSDKADVCPSCGYKVSDIKKDMSNFVYCKINGEDVDVTELRQRLLSISESERQDCQKWFSLGSDVKKIMAMSKELHASGKEEVFQNSDEIARMAQKKINLEFDNDLHLFLAEFISNNMEPIEFNGKPKRVPTDRELHIPKCPTCSSTNIRKLKSGEKATSEFGVLLGLPFNKTWKCNNCGHMW